MFGGCGKHRAMSLLLCCVVCGGPCQRVVVCLSRSSYLLCSHSVCVGGGRGAVNSVCEQSRNAGGGKGKEEKCKEWAARVYMNTRKGEVSVQSRYWPRIIIIVVIIVVVERERRGG